MILKYKLLSDKAVAPKYAHSTDAGMDLVATKIIKSTLFRVWYHTDVAVEIPVGCFGMLTPRSSISNDGTLMLANNVGIIDAGFRQGVQVRFNRTLKGFFTRKQYKVGERIAQVIIIPFKSVELSISDNELSTTERKGGYGSTGK
jgi:dUTP pyrophosphatase